MDAEHRTMMNAVAIDRFGDPDVLRVQPVPMPRPDPGEVLIRLEFAGVGSWDPFEREGGYAEMTGVTPAFPYILGSEGAGTVVSGGGDDRRFQEGDPVYAVGFLNPSGGFYAEHAAVPAEMVRPIPPGMRMDEAAVLSGAGLTALRGLDDVLEIREGESIIIFGASGGIGHLAVQLARRRGARVAAVASGTDGVELAKALGADVAVDGREGDVEAALHTFAPRGADAALLTAGGRGAGEALAALREGGRGAYPHGIYPEPDASPARSVTGYNCDPDGDLVRRLEQDARSAPLSPHLFRIFPLEHAAEAHRALDAHHVGKLALRIRPA